MDDLKKVTKKGETVTPSVTEKKTDTVLEKQDEKYGDYTATIIRDYYGSIDPFYLSEKNPEYAYRFLRDENKNISMKTGNLLLQKGGWQLCPKEHLLKDLKLPERELSPDGFLRRGDTILAFMPRKLYEEKEKYKMERAKAPVKQIKRMLKEGDSSIGGKDMHESMKGIQTKEQLGMK